MKASIKKGFGFGLTSGVITTLGMMVGLNASTGSKIAGRCLTKPASNPQRVLKMAPGYVYRDSESPLKPFTTQLAYGIIRPA